MTMIELRILTNLHQNFFAYQQMDTPLIGHRCRGCFML